MKSEEVLFKVERPESEEEADRSDGLSGGTLEASSLAELGEESLAQAEDDGGTKKKNDGGTKKKRTKRKASYPCRFCDKVFDQGQALGGHMNCHPEARTREKLLHYEKLLKQTNSRAFRTVNPRETSSYPISNFNQPGDVISSGYYSMVTPVQPTRFIQQPQRQMGPSQIWQVDPQQLSWLQVPTDGINLRGLTKDFTITPNLSTAYAASDATVNGNYVPHSMDSSMSSQLTSQYSVPAPSSMPYYVSYGYSARCDYLSGLGTYQEPRTDMHSLHTDGNSAPHDCGNSSCSVTYQEPQTDMHTQDHSAPCDYGNPSYLGTYQEPQTDMQSLHTQEGENFSSTLIMASSSSVQYHAQSSIDSFLEMGNQEMAVPRGTRLRPNPSDASDAGANHFDEWSGNPSDDPF